MKYKLIVITLILLVVAVSPAQATTAPAWYNADKFYPIQYQAWDTIDATRFDGIHDGITVLTGLDFDTTPDDLLQISGRCFLEYAPSFFYARLAVWYGGNVIPKYHPLAFTDDRTVTFSYTFMAGEYLQLQLYTDGVLAANRVKCNVAFEDVQ